MLLSFLCVYSETHHWPGTAHLPAFISVPAQSGGPSFPAACSTASHGAHLPFYRVLTATGASVHGAATLPLPAGAPVDPLGHFSGLYTQEWKMLVILPASMPTSRATGLL